MMLWQVPTYKLYKIYKTPATKEKRLCIKKIKDDKSMSTPYRYILCI